MPGLNLTDFYLKKFDDAGKRVARIGAPYFISFSVHNCEEAVLLFLPKLGRMNPLKLFENNLCAEIPLGECNNNNNNNRSNINMFKRISTLGKF